MKKIPIKEFLDLFGMDYAAMDKDGDKWAYENRPNDPNRAGNWTESNSIVRDVNDLVTFPENHDWKTLIYRVKPKPKNLTIDEAFECIKSGEDVWFWDNSCDNFTKSILLGYSKDGINYEAAISNGKWFVNCSRTKPEAI